MNCPVPGCPRKVGAGRALCGPCWHELPRDIGERLLAAKEQYVKRLNAAVLEVSSRKYGAVTR